MGHVDAERAAAPLARCLPRRGGVRLPRADTLREGLERTVAWYRSTAPAHAAGEPLAHLLERPLLLVAAAIALQWLTTLVVALRADSVDLDAAALLNVLVLRAGRDRRCSVCRRERGRPRPRRLDAPRLGGAAAAALYTLSKYDTTMRDDVLPLVLGLTGDAGYARRRDPGSAGAPDPGERVRQRPPPPPSCSGSPRSGSLALRTWTDSHSTRCRRTWRACGSTSSASACSVVPLASLIAVARRSVPRSRSAAGSAATSPSG